MRIPRASRAAGSLDFEKDERNNALDAAINSDMMVITTNTSNNENPPRRPCHQPPVPEPDGVPPSSPGPLFCASTCKCLYHAAFLGQ
ncbi:MAG: hypothetical protein NTW21_17580 [Verrucomicrobia bacterium]|nr:hypothetical protein [Verrucomicrobiota bacterium]